MFAGILGCCASISVSQPFDMLRFRMQVHPDRYPNLFRAVSTMLQQEGAIAFYRGTLSYLLTTAVAVSVRMNVCAESRKELVEWQIAEANSIKLFALSGIAVGTINSLISSPIEMVRARL